MSDGGDAGSPRREGPGVRPWVVPSRWALGSPSGTGGHGLSCSVPPGLGTAPACRCRGAGGCPREGCSGAGGSHGFPAGKRCCTLCCSPSQFPCHFPRGQDRSCPAPTGRFRRPCTHRSALSLQGRHQINVHLVGVTPSPRLGTRHQPGANLTQAQRWQGLGRVGAAPPGECPACPRARSPRTGSLVGSARPRSAHGAATGLHRRRRLLRAGLFPGSADPARASRGPQRLCGCLVESRAAALRHSDHCAWATLAPETCLGPPRLLPPLLNDREQVRRVFCRERAQTRQQEQLEELGQGEP